MKDVRSFTERLAFFRERECHVLALAARTSALGAGFGVSFAELWLDPDTKARQVYQDTAVMGEDERAIAKIGLDQIAACAGIVWLPTSRRADDRRIHHLWEYHVDGAITGYDGTPQILPGTAEVDLRDGSAQIGGWTPAKARYLKQKRARAAKKGDAVPLHVGGWFEEKVQLYRQHGLRMAETKAKNAAIRTLGLRATYTVEELSRPFVVCRVIYLPDMTDESVKKMVTAHALRGASVLYMPHAMPAATATQEPDPVPTDPLLREDFPL